MQLAVSARRPGAHFPGPVSGACGRVAHSPWSGPFPPQAPQRLAPPCSPASAVLWPRPTSSLRSSQASDTSFPLRPRYDHRGRVKTSQVPVGGVHTCLGSQTPRSSPAPRQSAVRAMWPSTHSTVSALRITSFRRSITPPACAATDASSPASRPVTHGSRWNAVGYSFVPQDFHPLPPHQLAWRSECHEMSCSPCAERIFWRPFRHDALLPGSGSGCATPFQSLCVFGTGSSF